MGMFRGHSLKSRAWVWFQRIILCHPSSVHYLLSLFIGDSLQLSSTPLKAEWTHNFALHQKRCLLSSCRFSYSKGVMTMTALWPGHKSPNSQSLFTTHFSHCWWIENHSFPVSSSHRTFIAINQNDHFLSPWICQHAVQDYRRQRQASSCIDNPTSRDTAAIITAEAETALRPTNVQTLIHQQALPME